MKEEPKYAPCAGGCGGLGHPFYCLKCWIKERGKDFHKMEDAFTEKDGEYPAETIPVLKAYRNRRRG
jgi:hypothetical protein